MCILHGLFIQTLRPTSANAAQQRELNPMTQAIRSPITSFSSIVDDGSVSGAVRHKDVQELANLARCAQ